MRCATPRVGSAASSTMSDLLTVAEVAEQLCVHANTVRKWCAEGKVDAFQTPGGSWRINPRSVPALNGARDD